MGEEVRKIPKIRFKGYTDEWEERKLGDLAEIVRGASPRPIQDPKWFDVKSEVGWLRISDVTEQDGRIFYLEQRISKLGQQKTRVLNEPHLLLSIAATVGKPVVNYVKTGVHDGFLIFLNPKFEREFMFQWLEMFRPMWQRYGQPGSQVNLNSDLVKNQEVVLPSIDEQIKIGEVLSQFDNLITLHQRKLDLLKVTKKSMLQKMFPKNGERVPEIRFAGFTDEWEQRKLGNIIDYIVDNRGKNPSYYCKDGLPVIDNYMIKNTLYPDLVTANRFIDEYLFDNFIRKYNETDDILITLVGNGIGNISLFPNSKAVIIQNTIGLRTSENKRFLFFLLMAKNKEVVALDRGMAQPSIRQDEILDIDILIPKNKEQQKIGEYFSNFDNLITLHQRELDLLKDLKKSMLQQMFI